jgi:hypothetical protein
VTRVVSTVLAAGLLIAMRAEIAEAGSCGGGGGSSGGGSSGGGSSSGSSSSSDSSSSDSSPSSSSSTPACVDTSDVVGYRHCTPYGRWGLHLKMPQVIIELGTSVRSFRNPHEAQTGHVTHERSSFTFRTVGPTGTDPANDAAVVTTLRLGIGSRSGFYGALEGEIGGLVRDSAGAAEMTSSGPLGSPSIAKTGALVSSAFGVIGMRGGARNQFAVELVGGMRNVHYSYESHYLACETTSSVSAALPVLEARVKVSTWASPFFNVGLTAGKSLIDQGDWMAGLYLGVHTHALAGNR